MRPSPPDIRRRPVPELVIGVTRLRRYAEIYPPYNCAFFAPHAFAEFVRRFFVKSQGRFIASASVL